MRDGFLKIGLLPAILILIMIAFEPPGVSLPSLTAAVIHECGHLFAARLLKIELRSLDIGPLGATIRTRGSLISYGCEWLLCAAGPAANLASGAAAYMIFHGSERFPPGGTAVGSLAGPRAARGLLSFCSVISLCGLWMLSVYLLLRWGASLSLFIFSASVFCRIFIESDEHGGI